MPMPRLPRSGHSPARPPGQMERLTHTEPALGGQSWHDALTREPLVLSLREGSAWVVDLLSTVFDALRKRALDLHLVGVLGPAGYGWATAETLRPTAQLPSPAFVVLQSGRFRGCLQLARSLTGGPILIAVPGQIAAALFGHSNPPPPPLPPSPAGPGPAAASLATRSTTPPALRTDHQPGARGSTTPCPHDVLSLCAHCPDCLTLWPMGTLPPSQRCSFCPTQTALVQRTG